MLLVVLGLYFIYWNSLESLINFVLFDFYFLVLYSVSFKDSVDFLLVFILFGFKLSILGI